jgi:hypothetical protein
MGFSIHYRSTETMHPAQAYAIKQHAERLIDGYTWLACEPVILQQQSDGYLTGHSKPNFFPAEIDADAAHLEGLPDGTVLTLAEVLCVLSREHGVDWDIGHDFEPDSIGCICGGVANSELMEQLETVGSIGDLLDDAFDEVESDWESEDFDLVDPESGDDDRDDDGPRVLKFPGS